MLAEDGSVVGAVLDTVNGYTFTAVAASRAAQRVIKGESRPGFHTSAGLFGCGFVQSVADSRVIDL